MVIEQTASQNKLRKKIEELEEEYQALVNYLAHPEKSDARDYQEKLKRLGALRETVELGKKYLGLLNKRDELVRLMDEDDFRELVLEELSAIDSEILAIQQNLQERFFSVPADFRDAIVEIRAGTGGQEASLFARDLFRMYSRYAEKKGFEIEVLSAHGSDLGGWKEIIFLVKGKNAFAHLKYERGVHRVQRVPVTEASGRIHTSAATVAVFPYIEEGEIKINPDDLKIDTFCASGHGGQSVNTTYSAVRITHLPTGITVSCQDERSQTQNKIRAMKILRARLQDAAERQKTEEIAKQRKQQVRSGDRSEKIRTYNFPQNRVTDHRINLTLYRCQEILDGDLDEFVEHLKKEAINESS